MDEHMRRLLQRSRERFMHRALFQGKWRELFGNMILIAEVKPESKLSGWRSPHSIDLLMETACRCGDWISIHTNPLWGGSFEWLSLARAYVNEFYQNVPVTARPPILAKGFHETLEEQQQALQLADYALVVREDSPQGPANILNRVLYEPHSLDGLAGAPQGMRCVWNARDIVGALEAYSSGRKSDHHTAKRANFDKARKLRRGWLCQASNIKTPKDVHPKANAVLIGTNLIEFTSEILPQ